MWYSNQRPICLNEFLQEIESSVFELGGGQRHVAHEGEIVDWETLDTLLDYVFYERLGWERGQEGTLLLCEPLCVTRSFSLFVTL